MGLQKQDVEHIAKLARLELSEAEIDMYTEQLSVVLDYIDQLQEVNTDGVEETCQVTGLSDVVREDVALSITEEERQKLLALFPQKKDNLLKVKGVFTNDDE